MVGTEAVVYVLPVAEEEVVVVMGAHLAVQVEHGGRTPLVVVALAVLALVLLVQWEHRIHLAPGMAVVVGVVGLVPMVVRVVQVVPQAAAVVLVGLTTVLQVGPVEWVESEK